MPHDEDEPEVSDVEDLDLEDILDTNVRPKRGPDQRIETPGVESEEDYGNIGGN